MWFLLLHSWTTLALVNLATWRTHRVQFGEGLIAVYDLQRGTRIRDDDEDFCALLHLAFLAVAAAATLGPRLLIAVAVDRIT